MDVVTVVLVGAFIGSHLAGRRRARRREYAILLMEERMANITLAIEMEDAGFNLVELHVNERGDRLRDNAEWN